MTTNQTQERDARLHLVEEHVRRENAHDLAGIMATFGTHDQYEDAPWAERHLGREAVEQYYADLLLALPDLTIDIQNRLVAEPCIALEVLLTGTHSRSWRGLPATGRRIRLPLCALYSFDETGRLAGDRIYYDRATVLRQLGFFHEPATLGGRLLTAVMHPLAITRALLRAAVSRPAS
ncbi:MAG: ester cyclase [Nitrospirales bacterium]